MADRRRLIRPFPMTRIGMTDRPWHRESRPSQCFTRPEDRPSYPSFLNAKQWVFLRSGLDDFRRGCPPCDSMLTRGLPPRPPAPERPGTLTKEELCSKLSPAQRARRALVEKMEAELTQHPLAPYPNLGKDLPPELLFKVLKLLDPDKKLKDAWARCEGHREETEGPRKLLKKRPTEGQQKLPKKTPLSRPGQLPYEKKKPSEKDLLPGDGPSYENARRAVRELCRWATENGGAEIDEEYIMKQFEENYASNLRQKARHTMKVDQVSQELKKGSKCKKVQDAELVQEPRRPENKAKPKHMKMRYGAWYLNPKEWKRQRADEPLVDPKLLHKIQEEKLKKEQQEKEDIFGKLHGPVAFKEYILKKGYRMPKILEKVCLRKDCKCGCNNTQYLDSLD